MSASTTRRAALKAMAAAAPALLSWQFTEELEKQLEALPFALSDHEGHVIVESAAGPLRQLAQCGLSQYADLRNMPTFSC
jgi:hypothetical protein